MVPPRRDGSVGSRAGGRESHGEAHGKQAGRKADMKKDPEGSSFSMLPRLDSNQ